jgi:hypothetical protein
MAEFKANLNPVTNKMDIIDLLKMDDYMGRRSAAKAAAKPSNVIKSSPDDVGVLFKFNSNQNANDTTG